jgi:hypothetical protein
VFSVGFSVLRLKDEKMDGRGVFEQGPGSCMHYHKEKTLAGNLLL